MGHVPKVSKKGKKRKKADKKVEEKKNISDKKVEEKGKEEVTGCAYEETCPDLSLFQQCFCSAKVAWQHDSNADASRKDAMVAWSS